MLSTTRCLLFANTDAYEKENKVTYQLLSYGSYMSSHLQYIYIIQHEFLLHVAVKMDKAACHFSNIRFKRHARACTGAAAMLEPALPMGLSMMVSRVSLCH